MAENKKGRKKQDFERIHNKTDRIIAFSKKKLGLFSKAEAFASAFGCEVAVIIRTECNKWYANSCLPSQGNMTNLLSYFLENQILSNHTTAVDMKAVRN